jgi:hypothetical protein
MAAGIRGQVGRQVVAAVAAPEMVMAVDDRQLRLQHRLRGTALPGRERGQRPHRVAPGVIGRDHADISSAIPRHVFARQGSTGPAAGCGSVGIAA